MPVTLVPPENWSKINAEQPSRGPHCSLARARCARSGPTQQQHRNRGDSRRDRRPVGAPRAARAGHRRACCDGRTRARRFPASRATCATATSPSTRKVRPSGSVREFALGSASRPMSPKTSGSGSRLRPAATTPSRQTSRSTRASAANLSVSIAHSSPGPRRTSSRSRAARWRTRSIGPAIITSSTTTT